MSGSQASLGLNGGEDATISYESGVDINGNVLAVNGHAPQGPGAPGADVAHKYGAGTTGTTGGVVTYNFNGPWTAAQEAQIADGLALWSDVANVTFRFVASTNPDDAQQTFFDDTTPFDPNTGLTYHGTYTVDGEATDAVPGTKTIAEVPGGYVSVQTTVPGWKDVSSFTQDGYDNKGYGITTMVHEEGHVLGLAHTGDYNADGVGPVSYNQLSPYDSKQWSIMSYIDPYDTTSAYYNQSVVQNTIWDGGTPQTWMPLDILAVQRLYGVRTDGPLSGGQTFGFNCNVQGGSEDFFDFTKNTTPIITLWDLGYNNRLDLSGWATAATVDLRAGHFSSADGLTNNIGIGFGVHIDNAVGTTGGDSFVVNEDSDTLLGHGQADQASFADPGGVWKETVVAVNTSIWAGSTLADQLIDVPTETFAGGADTIVATAAVDHVNVYGTRNAVFLSSANATAQSNGGNTFVVTAGLTDIVSITNPGSQGDVVYGQLGAGVLFHGASGNDTIVANQAGLVGGSRGLLAFEQGPAAQLDLSYSAGASTVVGNATGSVTVTAGLNGVDVGGGAGNNLIELNGSAGVAFGGGNGDSIYSDTGGGTSYIIGGAGAELLDARGGSGEQVIYAGSGNDIIAGGSGTNVIAAGHGNATAYGGSGATLYEFQAGSAGGLFVIADYNPAQDYLGFYGYQANAAQAAFYDARSDGQGNTLVTLSDNTRIALIGAASPGIATHFFGS